MSQWDRSLFTSCFHASSRPQCYVTISFFLMLQVVQYPSCQHDSKKMHQSSVITASTPSSPLLSLLMQRSSVRPLWAAAWSVPLIWRRTITRGWCATTNSARTATGCIYSASTSGRAPFWCSSTASAVHGLGTRSSAGRTCGPRRDMTWPSGSAPAAAARVI